MFSDKGICPSCMQRVSPDAANCGICGVSLASTSFQPGGIKMERMVPVETDEGGGMIQNIGKFLLDQNDLDKLGKLVNSDFVDSKVRVMGLGDFEGLSELLADIGPRQEVIGSLVVGSDGMLIANTMPRDIDAENLGVWAMGIFLNTDQALHKMNSDRVQQIVALTVQGYLVIAKFAGGFLLTLSNEQDTTKLIPLMESINALVAPV